MHIFLSAFLLFFAGWSVAAHVCVLFGLNLNALLILTPFVVISLFGAYIFFLKSKKQFINNQSQPRFCVNVNNKKILTLSVAALIITPIAIHVSWIVFWMLSILILILSIIRGDEVEVSKPNTAFGNSKYLKFFVFALISMAAIGIAFIVNRSDLDDAFYVSVASFLSSNPTHTILSTDPMLGETNFPLIFPSYHFASFELLSGAIAYLMSVPAMDIYYIYLLPIWVVASVAATFLLTKEINPKHWLLAGSIAFLFTVLLGEMHRSPANFSYVRIFQGKAVFLSVIVPTFFYLTARFFSERGTKGDLFLLACCQVVSVGLSNFGMLMGPVAGLGAIVSNFPLILKGELKKLYYAFAVLFIPLPYLIDVALESVGTSVRTFQFESSADVWTSVFGKNQQYLMAFLILAGPVIAKSTVTRWRLAVPPLIFFALYLNPWLANFISKYVTTPPVYWRVIWSFPILIYAAIAFCLLMVDLFEKKTPRMISVVLLIIALSLTIYSLPFHTLRTQNIGPFEGFATWKVPRDHLLVAKKSLEINTNGGRLLAPDEIAGVISRFEERPRLISTRGMYLSLMKPMVGESVYAPRQLLYDFVIGKDNTEIEKVRLALRSLNVSVIVISYGNQKTDALSLLKSEGFKQRESLYGYTIWAKNSL